MCSSVEGVRETTNIGVLGASFKREIGVCSEGDPVMGTCLFYYRTSALTGCCPVQLRRRQNVTYVILNDQHVRV